MRPYLDDLNRLKHATGPGLAREHGLECETGEALDAAYLKLRKKAWTDGGFGEGIFFSVWVSAKDLKKLRYNIHALKLRSLREYDLQSREFAAAFRARLGAAGWPNLRIDYGPQTLMEGWVIFEPKTFDREVLELVRRFVAMHGLIDELLEARRKPAKAFPGKLAASRFRQL